MCSYYKKNKQKTKKETKKPTEAKGLIKCLIYFYIAMTFENSNLLSGSNTKQIIQFICYEKTGTIRIFTHISGL